MTDRERWTIYPLLVLSIGMQVRDKLVPAKTIRAQSIHCQALTIDNGDKSPRILASANGTVQVLGADNKARVVLGIAPNHAGVVDVRGADGQRRAALLVDEGQQIGSLATFGPDGERRVVVAAGEGGGGLITVHGPVGRQLVALGMGKPLAGLVTSPAAANADEAQPDAEVPPPPLGGQLALFSDEGKPQWLLTHDERGAGRALAFDEQGHLYLVLMATLNVTPGPPGRAQPAADAPPTAEPADPADAPSDPAAQPGNPAEPPAAGESAVPSPDEPATEPPATEPPANESSRPAAPPRPEPSEAGDAARP